MRSLRVPQRTLGIRLQAESLLQRPLKAEPKQGKSASGNRGFMVKQGTVIKEYFMTSPFSSKLFPARSHDSSFDARH